MRQLITMVVAWLVAAATAWTADAAGLDGSRLAVLGDSMTWIGGDSCQNTNGWTHYVKQMASPAQIDIYARSGATWTNTSATRGDTSFYSEILADENVLYPQALRLMDACRSDRRHVPDVILLYAGANDAWFVRQRPGIFDVSGINPAPDSKPSDCTSLDASVRLVCGLLKREFPEARIVLITPVEMTKAPVWRVRLVSEVIARVGRDLGLTVIRPDLDVDIRSEQESITLTNTVDGVHTNPRGAELIARHVVSKLQ